MELVLQASDNFTKIISTEEIQSNYPTLYWGGNGVGSRWANQKFNYSVLYKNNSKAPRLYSENESDKIPDGLLADFIKANNNANGIIGIFVHSVRTNTQKRPIRSDIHAEVVRKSCVVCGTHKTVCDHKNDLYNDARVLQTNTQMVSDFQPLCEHCNLQKRQVCRTEEQTGKLYSAKNIETYRSYPFEFPWEKKAFDKNDIHCKIGTYWFDPAEFNRNINSYTTYVLPIVREIKRRVNTNRMIVLQ